MRYADIYKFDISNGIGIRVSLFVQGCPFHCKGCFNPETWDFKGGLQYDHKVNNYLMSLCDHEYVSGLSILGGEPLSSRNVGTVMGICDQFKKLFPNKNIWVWTGYTMEELNERCKSENDLMYLLYGNTITGANKPDLSKQIGLVDTLIDGQFKEDKKDLSLLWRGSSNQRIWTNKNGIWINN